MLIDVRQEHIDAGNPDLSHSCPLALAALDAGLPEAWVSVDHLSFFDPVDGLVRTVPLSGRARRFVAAVDAYKRVAPARFRLSGVE